MKNLVCLLIASMLAFVVPAVAADYNYVAPGQFKQWLESGKAMNIVDIQVPAQFQKHHFKGSLETNAFPAKSTEEKQKLDKIIPLLAAGKSDIVVVCPRGGGGAKNTYEYLKEKGISDKRIFILKDGMQGWPYKEML
ncbi:rhodanese-like domain-containing protein [Pelotalea chapellei]|uniref:Rhodanese-like domain-containing protein n=1 Tax=Pelotalea chapellei TaxID=44671 RepID=A0ABS5UB71_9BACT|nr:rhodanese-like domain-containing protein [Pelotalea chapellei]MBT1072949.1 rhodanese-like domain-containing protein [Pelotalea chapellei]